MYLRSSSSARFVRSSSQSMWFFALSWTRSLFTQYAVRDEQVDLRTDDFDFSFVVHHADSLAPRPHKPGNCEGVHPPSLGLHRNLVDAQKLYVSFTEFCRACSCGEQNVCSCAPSISSRFLHRKCQIGDIELFRQLVVSQQVLGIVQSQ